MGELADTSVWERKRITLLEGSHALPARISDKDVMKVKMLEW
jgi:hypothetical protein